MRDAIYEALAVFVVVFLALFAVLEIGQHVRPAAAAQTTTTAARRIIGANLTGYMMDTATAQKFSGCLATDTGCTMKVIVCVGVHGAPAGTPLVGCLPLPANTYDVAVYFQRAGGTELPNGALTGPVALAVSLVLAQ